MYKYRAILKTPYEDEPLTGTILEIVTSTGIFCYFRNAASTEWELVPRGSFLQIGAAYRVSKDCFSVESENA